MNPPSKTTAAVGFGLRFLFRFLGWILSAAFALVVLLYFAMPAALRFGIPHALSRYGITSSIESARVDIAEEKITLVGFSVGPNGGPGIRWSEVVALVDLTALMRGNIRIIDIQVKEARVDLEQLAAADWRSPVAETDAAANFLQFDVGDAAIRDLEFIGLSEKLGRPVSLRSLKIGSLSKLDRGDQVAFELEGALGEAKLKLAGIARLEANLPVVEGRYELGAFALDGLATALNMAGRASVKGRTDGAGTFRLRYQPERAMAKLGISGRLAVHGLGLDSPIIDVTEAGIDWDGVLNMDWPLGGEQPSFTADGSAVAHRVAAGLKKNGESLKFDADGLRWNGEIRLRDSLSIAGEIKADAVAVAGGKTSGAWRLQSDGVIVDALRHNGTDDLRIGRVNANESRIFLTRDDVEHAASLDSVSLSNLVSGRDGYSIGTVKLDTARTMQGETARAEWNLSGLSSAGIDISNDGKLAIADLNLDQGEMSVSGTQVFMTAARASGVEGSAGKAWRVAEFSTASLRHQDDTSETWGDAVSIGGGQYLHDGEIRAESLGADRVRRLSSRVLDWELTSLAVAGLSGTARAMEAVKATAASFTHHSSPSGEIEIENTVASDVSFGRTTGSRASQLKFGKLHYRSEDNRSVTLTESTVLLPVFSRDGKFSVKRVDVNQLRFTNDAARTSEFEGVSTSGIEGDLDSGVRAGTVTVDHWRHDAAAGVNVKGKSLELRAVNAAFGAAIRADTAALDTLALDLSDGVAISAFGFTIQGPEFNPAGASLVADGARAREVGLRRGANRRLSLHDVEAGRLERPLPDVHALSYLRAIRAEALDEIIGTRLETGRLSLEALTASETGRIEFGRGKVERISLDDTRGTPAASFSASDITIEGGGIDPGKLIDLGHTRIRDVNAVAGFSEFSRFVLPKAPFSGGAEESTVELALSRLETHGEGRLSFFDRSTLPPFEISLAPFAASLENYQSGNAAAQARFTVEGKIDEFSSLRVNGSVSRKQEGVDLALAGKVTAFDLKRLNTYAAKHTSSTVRAGRGDATFDLEISGQKLTGDTQLVFSKVKFEQVADTNTVDRAQNLSLDNAFAMLKDKEDVVRVSVPLSGSLDDPQFDFSDAVAQAVIKTVQNTVMLTFKPLGLLVSVAGLVGVGDGLRFNPVSFDAGEASLTGESLTYLDTLAGELRNRPKVELRICGRAVPADLIVLEKSGADTDVSNGREPPAEQLNLAETRAAVVRRYLEQEKGIATGRLLECPATVESIAGSLPRAEVLMQVEGQSEAVGAQPRATGSGN